MSEQEVVEGAVVEEAKLEEVNLHLLQKLDSLIACATEADEILSLTEAVAKYNSSIRNNAIFTAEPTLDELDRSSTRAAVADILGGK